jgi:hypothetical protein
MKKQIKKESKKKQTIDPSKMRFCCECNKELSIDSFPILDCGLRSTVCSNCRKE